MRHKLFVLGLVVVTAGIGTVAQARNYPWCAVFGGPLGGSRNCGFTTFKQCMATVSGVGGFCNHNPRYVRTTRSSH